MDAEYATPLAGPTYRARTRYRLVGIFRQARSYQRGRGNGPLSYVRILALQRGEDVNGSELDLVPLGDQSVSGTPPVGEKPETSPPERTLLMLDRTGRT